MDAILHARTMLRASMHSSRQGQERRPRSGRAPPPCPPYRRRRARERPDHRLQRRPGAPAPAEDAVQLRLRRQSKIVQRPRAQRSLGAARPDPRQCEAFAERRPHDVRVVPQCWLNKVDTTTVALRRVHHEPLVLLEALVCCEHGRAVFGDGLQHDCLVPPQLLGGKLQGSTGMLHCYQHDPLVAAQPFRGPREGHAVVLASHFDNLVVVAQIWVRVLQGAAVALEGELHTIPLATEHDRRIAQRPAKNLQDADDRWPIPGIVAHARDFVDDVLPRRLLLRAIFVQLRAECIVHGLDEYL
mmetsp:Transcript_573/g.1486  ORF Transcript_573/g.1486 Transcript_573/m.1486 type:complete len:300 (+) Transcript_573:1-900(+)